jgi:hypothetical protein
VGNGGRFRNCHSKPAALAREAEIGALFGPQQKIVLGFESRLSPFKAGAQACLSATGSLRGKADDQNHIGSQIRNSQLFQPSYKAACAIGFELDASPIILSSAMSALGQERK